MRKIIFLLAVLLMSSISSAQTKRGDFNYDGWFDVSDVSSLIDYLLSGTWEQASVERETFTVNGEQFTMVYVIGGTVPSDDPYVTITIPDFWICQTEVTQELWKAVMGSNPSYNTLGNIKQLPVEQVSWNDCQEFISKLNALTGRQFRLPVTHEWEYAARGGTLSQGFRYAGGDNLNVLAWYKGNCWRTNPVATLGCNELALYDMCGNVVEWCGNLASAEKAMMCGGCYYYDADKCEVTRKEAARLEYRDKKYGLRLAATAL